SAHVSPVPDDYQLTCCEISLDAGRYEVQVAGHPIELTISEFQLLECFLRNPERVLTRRQLLAEIGSGAPKISSRTIDTHVYRLRRKLPLNETFIRTVRGVGYGLFRKPGG
ncbi:MAG TPA: response regulator transcription factor, partial [Acidobacteriota bacterium]|nr:response regulator transcription factor [Acidobacteriota bacterium]